MVIAYQRRYRIAKSLFEKLKVGKLVYHVRKFEYPLHCSVVEYGVKRISKNRGKRMLAIQPILSLNATPPGSVKMIVDGEDLEVTEFDGMWCETLSHAFDYIDLSLREDLKFIDYQLQKLLERQTTYNAELKKWQR